MSRSLKICFALSIVLISAFIFLPLVWLKIGPIGYLTYGPNVDDVYLYGGIITGKDRSWEGINFAYKFQLLMILLVLATTIISYFRIRKGRTIIPLNVTNLGLILLFPLWLSMYIDGVINNSDGADLSVHLQLGMLNYIGIALLQLYILIRVLLRGRILKQMKT